MTHTMETTIGLRQSLDLFISISTLLATYVVLMAISWRATVVLTVVLAGLGLAVLRPITLAAHKAGTAYVRSNKAANSTFLELLGGIRYVKAYGQESRFRDQMTRSLTELRRSVISATWVGTMIHPVVETAVVLIFCTLIVVLARGAPGELSDQLPFLGVLAAAAFRLFPILSLIGGQWVGFISKRSSALAVLQAIGPRDAEPSGSSPFSGLEDAIDVARVGYSYAGRSAAALSDASLRIPRGSRIALVGESGSGKSTIVSLLLGFLRPHSGTILVDGTPLAELRLEQWRRRLGYVGQEGFVFNATLEENITLGRVEPSDPGVADALTATGLDAIVAELPQGLGTVVGERGLELSGGQRQRVALARAILLRPDLLILDEATSALDNEAAFEVMQRITRLLPDSTIVAVAHRLGSTSSFDRIYVVRAGRVVEEGSHQELISRQSYYFQLFNHEHTT